MKLITPRFAPTVALPTQIKIPVSVAQATGHPRIFVLIHGAKLPVGVIEFMLSDPRYRAWFIGDPLAGITPDGTAEPTAVVTPDGTAEPTTINPDGTATPATINPDGTATPTTINPDGTATPATINPNGTATPATINPDGTATPATINPDGTATPVVAPSAVGGRSRKRA